MLLPPRVRDSTTLSPAWLHVAAAESVIYTAFLWRSDELISRGSKSENRALASNDEAWKLGARSSSLALVFFFSHTLFFKFYLVRRQVNLVHIFPFLLNYDYSLLSLAYF